MLLQILLFLPLMANSLVESSIFTATLSRLGLSPDMYFDASYGVRVSGSPTSSLLCEEGNHCVRPWWTSDSNSNSTGSNGTSTSPSTAIQV